MRLQNCLQITLLAGALVASTVQLAGAELPDLPPSDLPPIEGPAPTPSDNNEPPTSPLPGSTDPTQALALTEADVVTLLLENNRELRNAALERIAQQQDLREAESIFDPDFTPTLSLGISDRSGDTAEITREARLGGELLTPLGTTLEVGVDLIDDQDVELTVTQPLLRGAGRAVNTTPVKIARLQETNNQLDLQQRLITDITNGVLTYHALIRTQASLGIQRLSLETQQQQRRSIAALVEAGRRARFELVEIDANLAATETGLLEAENELEQAKSNLLDLLDLADSIDITIPDTTLATLSTAAEVTDMPGLDELVAVAYANRPDYQQTQLNLEIAKLNGIVAADNRRWNLDLRANASTGDFSEASTELVLTRLLEDESTATALQRNQITQQQLQNDLDRLGADIRLDIADRLRDVDSARNRIESTRLARELAEQRLENAQTRARLGRTRDIFEVLELQNDVVEAQNSEVNAAIDLADAIATLNQSLGTTLTVWSDQVEASQLLTLP
ncbi:MAG: TolC family protein [Cyanobacteria bacterium P01_H01_bin.26]